MMKVILIVRILACGMMPLELMFVSLPRMNLLSLFETAFFPIWNPTTDAVINKAKCQFFLTGIRKVSFNFNPVNMINNYAHLQNNVIIRKIYIFLLMEKVSSAINCAAGLLNFKFMVAHVYTLTMTNGEYKW